MKKPVLVIGAGGHAKVVIDIINQHKDYKVEAVIGRENEPIDTLLGYPVLKGDKYITIFREKGVTAAVSGIGGFVDNRRRTEIYQNLKDLGYELINLIHPSAVLSSSVRMGEGIVAYPGVIINTDVRIGNNVIFSSGAIISQETVIGDNVLISTGANVGGGCIIGSNAVIGLGASILARVRIGANALVAAGAVVIKDVPDNARVYGIPAREKS